MVLEPHIVFCAKAPAADYGPCPDARFPELPADVAATTALVTLRELLRHCGLDRPGFSSDRWNPLGDLIPQGGRVLIKPNWVHHRNRSLQGLACLVTHTSVLEAILHYVVKAGVGSVVVGDAPVQGCDFGALRAACRLDEMARRFASRGVDVQIKDFRRTILPGGRFHSRAQQDCRPLDEFVLFDLKEDSLLEPITKPGGEFRITMYDPEVLKSTHAPGRHQYLIARDVLEADVVINVPKLKTHAKAGITGALKNMVGINGHKDYLPHHRKGGSLEGGDCYLGKSPLKRLVEDLFDAANRARSPQRKYVFSKAAQAGMLVGRFLGADRNYEGSWYGNDTVWRMCLDLQRVLHYGRADGTLAQDPQRQVITVTDGIIAGQGNGPLAPTPVPLGLMTLGPNTAALEWVHALLMGLDPRRIPLVREAFADRRYPLARLRPAEIAIIADGRRVTPAELVAGWGRSFHPAAGWQGHCELIGPPAEVAASDSLPGDCP